MNSKACFRVKFIYI